MSEWPMEEPPLLTAFSAVVAACCRRGLAETFGQAETGGLSIELLDPSLDLRLSIAIELARALR